MKWKREKEKNERYRKKKDKWKRQKKEETKIDKCKKHKHTTKIEREDIGTYVGKRYRFIYNT
jgi:hypothetical protein